jgi:hypothetical protein
MAKQLAALLGGGLDLKALAEMLRRQGRGQDTILAHITPQEAALLKSRGGAGTMNPDTGLPEFETDPFLGSYEDLAPAEQQGLDLPVFSADTVSQPVNMNNARTFFDPNDPMASSQVSTTRSFAPNVSQVQPGGFGFGGVEPQFGLGMYDGEMVGPPQVRDTKQEAIDQAFSEPRNLADMIKSGAKQVLGTKEGLAGLGTVASLLQARQAGKQAQQMQRELSAIGAPQRALGQQMIAQGQRGELTPVQRQQMAALDARQKQQLAQRGLTSGTAQQQQQARMQEMQQRGAQDLIDQGIKIAGIGDQYQAAAIRAGYAADQATRDMLNTTLTNLYRTIYGNVATPETTSKTTPQRG